MHTSRFKPFAALLGALLILMTALPASAVPLTQIGIRYFERGHMAYLRHDMQDAARYFARSADSFLKYKEENGDIFDSYALQAGIGLYYSGDYDRCIQVLEPLADNDDLWEAPLYAALSYAHKDDASKARELLAKFPEIAKQHILSIAVNDALDKLRSGELTPAGLIDQLTPEIRRQLVFNIYADTQDSATAPERCDGRFWWRYASQRCHNNRPYDKLDY